MLESILSFYDRFAARNSTNSHLQHEAAVAYRRVGNLQDLLGHSERASDAYRRAAELFEALLESDPSDAEKRYDLAETYAMLDVARAAEESLPQAEAHLRRAIALCEETSPKPVDAPRRLDLLARAEGKLGLVQERMGRDSEAEARLRRAVSLRDSAPHQEAGYPLLDFDRIASRQALADFLVRHGRPEEARPLLRRCADDLRALVQSSPRGRRSSRMIPSMLDNLARTLRDLGETDLASKLTEDATRFRADSTPADFGPPRDRPRRIEGP
jgi:tetratricopeptide (TPR) repeat protein